MIIWILSYFILINGLAYYFIYQDKQRAIKQQWRIAERTFFLLSLAGGFLGMYNAMRQFHHKTKHWQFHFVVIISALFYLVILPAIFFYAV